MDAVIRCQYKAKEEGKVVLEENFILEVHTVERLDEAAPEAEFQAEILSLNYGWRLRRWGKRTWRVWDTNDGDIWITITGE